MNEDSITGKVTPNARVGERLFVIAILCLLIAIPPIMGEAFPLTATPMFAKALREKRTYALRDANGKRLSSDQYGLRTNVNYYLEHFYAVKFPETVVPPADQPPDVQHVIRHVRRIGQQQGVAFPLRLTCTVLGAVNDQTIGIVSEQTWLIEEREAK